MIWVKVYWTMLGTDTTVLSLLMGKQALESPIQWSGMGQTKVLTYLYSIRICTYVCAKYGQCWTIHIS